MVIMGIPPRDDAGRVIPHDDPDILDESYVVRYILSSQLVPDPRGGRRLSSGAFSRSSKQHDHYQGMSVDLLDAMLAKGVRPADKAGPDHEAIVKLQIGELRALGLCVGSDPIQDNPFHAGVWGLNSGMRKKIHAFSEWILKPEDIL